MRISKADLVPTDANLLSDCASFADQWGAFEAFCDEVNRRVHPETMRIPALALLVEQRPAPSVVGRRPPAVGQGELPVRTGSGVAVLRKTVLLVSGA